MNSRFLIYLFIMFTVTYLIRVLPLTLIRKKIHNRFLRSFLAYIPYTVLGTMTFPAMFYAVGNTAAGIAGAAVALIAAFCGGGLCTVAALASAAVYAVLLII
ncbi:MAG: AzlD domain-containing protein [Clostridiales bacterium]|nr:AzlD domain-containing protein [Clostridiales bacterium]